jgi:hypothetical protein
MKWLLVLFLMMSFCSQTRAEKFVRFVSIGVNEQDLIYSVDDRLLLRGKSSGQHNSKGVDGRTPALAVFEISETGDGILLLLRTEGDAVRVRDGKHDIETKYLTADFSADRAVLVLSRELTKKSYWHIEKSNPKEADPIEQFEGAKIRMPPNGAIYVKDDQNKSFYWSIDEQQTISFGQGSDRIADYHPIILSAQPKLKLHFELFTPRDGL